MALLLKKDGKNTIRSRLAGYMQLILGMALLALLCFFFFHGVSIWQYQKNMDKVLVLNDFFSELDMNYRKLYLYVQDGAKEALDELGDSRKRLDERMNALEDVQISEGFVRDIQDLYFVLQHYKEQSFLIQEKMQGGKTGTFTPQLLGEAVTLYRKAGEIYQVMSAQYKDLHLTLIHEANIVQTSLNTRVVQCYMLMIIIALIFVTLSVRHASRLAEGIAEPIQTLTAGAKFVRTGDIDQFQSVVIAPSSYDEITTLIAVFNMTIHQLKDYIQVMEENARTTEALHIQEMENLRITSLLKASELKALQMQMNPHFLFNTLNMISRSVDMGDTDRTVLMLHKTAQLLRYSLDYSGRMATLAKEIEMLGNYVFLQEQRFGSRIFFDFDLDECFHQIQVPSFILQPLVENSVVHGLGGNTRKGIVEIRTRYLPEEKTGQISIADNGEGMTRETQKRVMAGLDSDQEQREKIGLANVNMRLKLLFGENYMLEIFSNPGEGTEIRITLKKIER